MAKFRTFSESRFHVHILPITKFRTRHLSFKVACPMTRETVTATAILPYLWMEGTTKLPSALDIVRYTDKLFGAILQTSVGKRGGVHVLDVSALVPEEDGLAGAEGLFGKTAELAIQVLSDPFLEGQAFARKHVQREQNLHRKRIESVFDDKIQFAMERCVEEMCDGLPQGMPRLGYMDDIAEMSPDWLWDVHVSTLSNAEFHVYCIGHFDDPEKVAQTLLDSLRAAVPTPENRTSLTDVRAVQPRREDVHTVTDAQPVTQGKLNLGFRTGVSYSDEAYVPLLVGNGVLGGFPHSKLFMNVREKESLAYYASSRLDSLTGLVTVQTGIDPKNQERALEIIRQQVRVVQDGDISDDELAFTVRGLKNQYQQLLDQPHSLADVHFNGVLAGVERDTIDLMDDIAKVNKQDIVQASQSLALDTVYFLKGEEAAAHA